MKVAVVSIGSFDTQYSDYHIMRDIIVGLLERGHDVELIQKQYLDVPQYPQQFEKYLEKQLQVKNIRFEKKAKANLKARYMADLSYYRRACGALKKNKPDKIFLQSCNTAFFTVFYAKHILKCPLLYNEQDIFPENAYFSGILSESSPIYKVAYVLQKYAYKNATALSTISDDMKVTIATRYGVSEKKIRVVYNWGHEELKAHSEAENTFLKKYPKKPGEFRVVYAGNLGKMQNVELILKAAALMKEEPNVSFYIVGGGVNERQLKAFVKAKKLTNVKFVGMQPPEEVADLYAAADVNVIPLQKGLIYAALPSKTADCLIAGKPIITCVDDESAFAKLVRQYGIENAGTNQPEKIKQIILKLMNSAQKCDAAELWNGYFTMNKSIAAYCDAIERME
ncbi:UNVERIFIED_CONTAM: glycosyltransferase family 4 protein [Bacteroidetes bacterium 56_B9]